MDKELRNGIIKPTVLFLIIFVLGITLIDFTVIKFLSGKSKNEVIELYQSNKEIFHKVVDELKGEYLEKENQDISFRITDENLTIKKYIGNIPANTVDIIELQEQDCDKYKNTIKIMGKLKISAISTDYRTITFVVSSNVGYGKDIAYISQYSDINQYKEDNYVKKMEKIEENWYYIEAE